MVTGDVISGGDITLKEGSTVEGNVIAAGEVDLKDGAIVTGEIHENADVPTFEMVNVSVSSSGTNITVKKGETRALDPGSYGKLVLKEQATLILK